MMPVEKAVESVNNFMHILLSRRIDTIDMSMITSSCFASDTLRQNRENSRMPRKPRAYLPLPMGMETLELMPSSPACDFR